MRRRRLIRRKFKPVRRRYVRKAGFKNRSNHAVTRTLIYSQSKTYPANGGEFSGMTFTLNSLVDATELAAWKQLYDQYQIKGVSVRWVPKTNVNSITDGSGSSPTLISEIMTAIDLDDGSAPGTVAEILNYGTVRRQRFNKEHKRYLMPRAATQIYNGLTTSYGLLSRSTWLDLDDDTIPHYGIKYVITPATTDPTEGANIYYDMYVRAYIAFKNKV